MAKKKFVFFTLLMMVLLAATAAQADLTITPWRVVFGPRARSAIVELINATEKTNTYRLGWMLQKATPDGKYEPVMNPKDKNPFGVENMVIFTPRQVTVEPHGHQAIRLSLRRPKDLPPGEYRAHLSMTQMANQVQPKSDPTAKELELALQANLGFTIPVIVRQGEDRDLKISLSNASLKMEKNVPVLSLDINRDAGKFSSYGTIKVYMKSSKGDEKQVGEQGNMALYPEVKTRHIKVYLSKKENYNSGALHIVYDGTLDAEGTRWAEKTFPIGGM